MFLAQPGAFPDGSDARIRFDSGQFEPFEAGFAEFLHDPVVQAAPLDGAAAVGHQHPRAVFLQLTAEVVELVPAEIHFHRDIINEIVNHIVCL